MIHVDDGKKIAASITFSGRKIQVTFKTPRELVQALRDYGSALTAVHKIYFKKG